MEGIKFVHASVAKCLSSCEEKPSYFKLALKWVNIIKTDQFRKAIPRENVASWIYMGTDEGHEGWLLSAKLQHPFHLVCK